MILKALPVLAVALSAGCTTFAGAEIREKAPPLVDMEEPLELHGEPRDEAERQKLDPGAFTGITVRSARRSLDESNGDEPGLLVSSVAENSPADAAGVREDDLLVQVRDGAGGVHELRWPSQWRAVEQGAEAGSTLSLLIDRAGREFETTVHVTRRVRAAERHTVERFRETLRVGIVVRTATEVEGRPAGLGPGGGAVVVGLSRGSPWRKEGLLYGDVIVRVDDTRIDHPQALLDVIRDAEEDAALTVDFLREGELYEATFAVSKRAQEMTHFGIPLVFSYRKDGATSEWKALLGLFQHRTTATAWEWTVLGFIKFGGGESDHLEEVE